MIVDLLALAACALWAWFGWRRGALSTGIGLAGLVGGYAAALLLHRPLGSVLASRAAVPEPWASGLAGGLAFVAAFAALRLIGGRLARRRAERIEGGWTPPFADRLGGAALGAATAGAVVLVLAWAGETAASLRAPETGDAVLADLSGSGAGVDGSRRAGAASGVSLEGGRGAAGATATGGPSGGSVEGAAPTGSVGGPLDGSAAADGPVGGSAADSSRSGAVGPGGPGPSPRRSVVGRLGVAAAERTVEAAVRLTGGDERTAAAAAAVVARPADARTAFRTLVRRDDARSLATDEALRAAFWEGDAGAIAGHPGVRRLLEDPAVRDALRSLRVVDIDGSSTPEAMAGELAGAVASLGPGLENLRGDPAFVAALERSRLRERIRSGDVAGLAGDPDVVWMIGRVREVLARRR